jgi:hypothetical protein
MTQRWRRWFRDDSEIPADPRPVPNPECPEFEVWDRQLAETGQVVFGKQPIKVAVLLLALVAVILLVCPWAPVLVRLAGLNWLAISGGVAVPLQYQLLTAPGPPMTVTEDGLHLSLRRYEPLTVSWDEIERTEVHRSGRSWWIRVWLTDEAQQRITGARHVKGEPVYLPKFMRGRKSAVVAWLNLQVARHVDRSDSSRP